MDGDPWYRGLKLFPVVPNLEEFFQSFFRHRSKLHRNGISIFIWVRAEAREKLKNKGLVGFSAAGGRIVEEGVYVDDKSCPLPHKKGKLAVPF